MTTSRPPTIFEFPNPQAGGDRKKILQFEVRHWITNREGVESENTKETGYTYMVSSDNTVGNLFYGSRGYMTKNVNQWQTYLGKERVPGEKGSGLGDHYADFVSAIRANDQKLANGDIREGFYSCALMHLGNISYRLGKTLEFDPVKMKFTDSPEANAMLRRTYREPYVVPDKV